MIRHLSAAALVVLALAGGARADRKDPAWLLPAPELDRDPKIPSLKEVAGHAWGQDVSNSTEVERYVHALAKAAPDRTRLERYGESYEKRGLHYLVISSPANIRLLDEIRRDHLALADPRRTAAERAAEIAAKAPAVVWLAYCVHGNETSPSDAALLTAYHLLADRRPATRQLLEKLVVVIDPLQNPDGRDRFVNFHREGRGAFVQGDPLAADRIERWPGGRFNHYLFDMNRDWYRQSQQESKARVAAYLKWQPQIFVDAHEMGANSSFFFDPPAEPVSPFVLPRQRDWYAKIGKHHATRFDEHGFAYTTREMFDAFGPQYGSTWPTMHGAIGILWEQAGVRGTRIDRKDDTRLHYHDAVRNHYVSGIATLEIAAERRGELLRDFYQTRADSVALGRKGPVHDFFLLEGGRPSRALELARLLARNGIEVQRVQRELRGKFADVAEATAEERVVPAGSYHVAVAQPAARLVRSLLDRHVDMGEAFVKRQLERAKRGQRDEIYDGTAWSLPLAFGVTCLAAEGPSSVVSKPWVEGRNPGAVIGGPAKVAYLVNGDDDAAALALCEWLRAGLRVHVASEPLKLNGTAFGMGSLIVKVRENGAGVHEAVEKAAHAHGLRVHAANTAFVDEGAGLGGPNVRWVKPPRVLLAVDRPTSYGVGHTWYLFDEVWRYPVTRVACRNLGGVDLRKYDVLILPDGIYANDTLDEPPALRIREWVKQGGTLILVKGAAAWAAGDKVKLLAGRPEQPPAKGDKAAGEKPPPREAGQRVPGAFLRAEVEEGHWVTFGVKKSTAIHFSGNLQLTALKRGEGKNLVTFVEGERLLASGFCWPQTLKRMEGRPYAVYQSSGSGHIVAFADDPNFRAMCPEAQRLFLNAVLFGPGQ